MTELGILLALLLLNGVFSASELALMSARKSRLEAAAEQGDRAAAQALRLAEQPGAFLATVQVGITLIGTISAIFAGENLVKYVSPLLRPWLGGYAGPVAEALVVLLVTYLSLVLGELAPKNVALRNPEALARRVAPLMLRLSGLARPAVWLLDATTRGLLRLFGVVGERQEFVTEEDVKALVEQATESGSLEPAESERIERALRFTDRRVRDLMTPRTAVTVLDLAAPLEVSVDIALLAGHDHYPVRRGDEDVVGVLSVLELLRAVRTGGDVAALVKPAVFLPEAAWAEDALTQLDRHEQARIAIVVDEYGDFTGLLSLSDLLAELAGTHEGPEEDDAIVRREDGSYLVDASLGLHEVRQTLPLPELQSEDFSTVAGYVLSVMGHLPAVGERAQEQGWRIEVMDLDGARVDRVLITPPA